MKLSQDFNIKQNQILTTSLKRALLILTLPVDELNEYIDKEIEKNPLLQKVIKNNIPGANHRLDHYPAEQTTYENLISQAKQILDNRQELKIAKQIIGNLDEKGFLSAEISEIAKILNIKTITIINVLKKIQALHPIGIASKNLREYFLIQLVHKGKKNSIGYRIVKDHFEDLLQNRISLLKKKLKKTKKQIQESFFQDIKPLNFRPIHSHSNNNAKWITPDIILDREKNKWIIEINEERFPLFIIKSEQIYLTKEVQKSSFYQNHLQSGKWLMKNINRRQKTLKNITIFLLTHQSLFFQKGKKTAYCSIKQLALYLDVHPSTAARALSNKYIKCSYGIFPLKFFFSRDSERGSLSTLQKQLLTFIEKEDKNNPLSDEKLCLALKEKGIECSRRTIAKHRQKLQIASARVRKKHF